jgi:AraC family transcriptional regulator
MELIQSELGTDLSLARLADEIGISPHHFARVFRETFAVTPHAYVQDCRLKAAAMALRKDLDQSIADIALACGFASQSHMTELMRRKLGATPRAIRLGK